MIVLLPPEIITCIARGRDAPRNNLSRFIYMPDRSRWAAAMVIRIRCRSMCRGKT